MPDTEPIEIEHIAPLSEDSIPDVNQSHFCFSCDAAIVGLFCASCGQKNDDFRRSIFSLVTEFIASITAFESRIWRTWGNLLFKPGKVAREYSDGRRSHWSSPVRVYLAMSIILFGYMSVSQTQLISIEIDLIPKKGVTKSVQDYQIEDVCVLPKVQYFQRQKVIDRRNAKKDIELIEAKLVDGSDFLFNLNVSEGGVTGSELTCDPPVKGDRPTETGLEDALREPTDIDAALEKEIERLKQATGHTHDAALDRLASGVVPVQVKTALLRAINESTENNADGTPQFDDEALIEIRGILDTIEKNVGTDGGIVVNGQEISGAQASQFLIRAMRNPSELNSVFREDLPRLMFFMMPFTMLIGVIFIRGRGNALMYDHLVHAAYIHAVTFFLILFGVLMKRFIPAIPILQITIIGLLIYLPLSLKRMFNRGWIKTVWTTYWVGLLYLFVIMVILVILFSVDLTQSIRSPN